jgi:quercetin dioxygenase-like cupin family protein
VDVYEIRVHGRLDQHWAAWFHGLALTYEGECTVLRGSLMDETALYGVLAKVRDLSVRLLAVHVIEGDGPAPAPAGRSPKHEREHERIVRDLPPQPLRGAGTPQQAHHKGKAMNHMVAKFLAPEAGELVRLLGEPRVHKITPAETGGTYLQFETTHAPGAAVPPHLHRDEDEAFYVLAGQFEFAVGDQHFTATSGAFAFVPRGTVHAFTCTGEELGRMLITVTPGTGHEGLLREVKEVTERLGHSPETPQLLAMAERYGWVMAPR